MKDKAMRSEIWEGQGGRWGKILFWHQSLLFWNVSIGWNIYNKIYHFYHFKCTVEYNIVQPPSPPISRTLSRSHTETLHPLSNSSPSGLPWSLVTSVLLPIYMNLTILGTSCKWNPTVCVCAWFILLSIMFSRHLVFWTVCWVSLPDKGQEERIISLPFLQKRAPQRITNGAQESPSNWGVAAR